MERKTPKIRTDHICPPIPTRFCDWQAVYDNDEPNENGSMPAGYGNTKDEAIRDLIINYPRSGNICLQCHKPFFDGDTCAFGGCPNGGDF